MKVKPIMLVANLFVIAALTDDLENVLLRAEDIHIFE